MLPEPVSITTPVLSIAGSAYKISKDTYQHAYRKIYKASMGFSGDLLCNCVEVFKDIRKYWSLSKVMAQCIQLGRVSSGRFSKRMM
jgi:hypothetical protein